MARMQWADEGQGNHNPQVVINQSKGRSPIHMTVMAGDTLKLDASASKDPDADALHFHWWQQPEIGSAKVNIEGNEKPAATIHIPADAAGGSIHLICEVHDDGPFHLVAYRRIILSIR